MYISIACLFTTCLHFLFVNENEWLSQLYTRVSPPVWIDRIWKRRDKKNEVANVECFYGFTFWDISRDMRETEAFLWDNRCKFNMIPSLWTSWGKHTRRVYQKGVHPIKEGLLNSSRNPDVTLAVCDQTQRDKICLMPFAWHSIPHSPPPSHTPCCPGMGQFSRCILTNLQGGPGWGRSCETTGGEKR